MKTHSALAVANWFLSRKDAETAALTPMKLQKLIYFAHGWSLAITGVPLIKERPEAWDYGPVIPTVYNEFKKFGRNRITQKATKLDFDQLDDSKDPFSFSLIEPTVSDDPEADSLLTRVWEVYRNFSGIQLSNMTHTPNGAWYRTYHELAQNRRGVDIPDDLIKAEFVAKVPRANSEEHTAA